MASINQIISDIDNLSAAKSLSCLPDQCTRYLAGGVEELNIIHVNIRSIKKNFDNFVATLVPTGIHFDIIIMTECWLQVSGPLPSLSGYTAYSTANNRTQNDGVVVFVNTLKGFMVKEMVVRDAGCLVCWSDEFAVVAVYRSPSNIVLDGFYTDMECVLATLKQKNVALVGDLNVDIKLGNSDRRCDDYLTFFSALGFLPGHLIPTRLNNCLDHILLRSKLSSTVLVLEANITDHYPIVLSFRTKNFSFKRTVGKTVLKTDFLGVQRDLDSGDFGAVLSTDDAENAASALVDLIGSVVRRHTSECRVSSRNRILKPWLSTGLLRCIRNRDRMHNNLKSSPDNMVLKVTYTRYRNFCNTLLKNLKIAYQTAELEKARGNPKALWGVIGEVTNTKRVNRVPVELLGSHDDPRVACGLVNDYFVGLGRDLASKISVPTHSPNYKFTTDGVRAGVSLSILPIDVAEVETIINGLRSDCATGWDGISLGVIRRSCGALLPPITHVINLCIASGTFPRVFKRAIVHPVYKGGCRDSVSNYRPISVLSALSKILERYLNKCLLNFLDKHNILRHNQYGFRPHISAEDAVADFVSDVTSKIDKRLKCYGIFLDLSKAFDTVSVPILLSRLESIGVRGVCLKLFADYLGGRTQSVKIGMCVGDEETITYGVPQGSILGPTLFLIYINELCGVPIENCDIFTYADDTALLVWGKDWEAARFSAERALEVVGDWLARNLLTLNTDKSKFVRFSISKSSECDFSTGNLRIHTCRHLVSPCSCRSLSGVQSIKYLGVLLDEGLDWHIQIEALSARVRKLIYIFKELRGSADRATLRTVYFGLCQSVISYCISVWGVAGRTSFLRLERAQRAILKVAARKRRSFSTVRLYAEWGVLTVRQLAVFRILLRKHASLSLVRDSTVSVKRQGGIVCPSVRCRTSWARRQFPALGCRLYNRVNRELTGLLTSLSRYSFKLAVVDYLRGLDYSQSEDLLSIAS